MSKPSDWPLGDRSSRIVAPVVIREKLARHPLSKDCYPLAVGYYQSASNHRMRRERHDDNILIYCFDGLGTLATEHWKGRVNKGELVLLPRGVGHEYRADDEDPLVHLLVPLLGVTFSGLSKEYGIPV